MHCEQVCDVDFGDEVRRGDVKLRQGKCLETNNSSFPPLDVCISSPSPSTLPPPPPPTSGDLSMRRSCASPSFSADVLSSPSTVVTSPLCRGGIWNSISWNVTVAKSDLITCLVTAEGVDVFRGGDKDGGVRRGKRVRGSHVRVSPIPVTICSGRSILMRCLILYEAIFT